MNEGARATVSRTLDRRAFLGAGVGALAMTLAAPRSRVTAAERSVVVEDWHAALVGSSGVPAGWSRYETPGGHPAYDFTIVMDGGRSVLRLKSASEHSTIAKEITVDLSATPLLRWDWKVLRFPPGADL